MSSNHINTLNKCDSVNHCKSKSTMLTREENIEWGKVTKVKSQTPKLYEVNLLK